MIGQLQTKFFELTNKRLFVLKFGFEFQIHSDCNFNKTFWLDWIFLTFCTITKYIINDETTFVDDLDSDPLRLFQNKQEKVYKYDDNTPLRCVGPRWIQPLFIITFVRNRKQHPGPGGMVFFNQNEISILYYEFYSL